jgi:asparagine synthase (glutamine-hydrolysing)
VAGDLSPEFGRIAGWAGEPFGDASSIPMFFLSREIRRHATVALTGDGGDELFGGYSHYREGMGIWGGRPPAPGSRSAGRRWLLRGMGLDRGFLRMQRHVNGALRRKLFTAGALSGTDPKKTLLERRNGIAGAAGPAHVLARMQNCDFHTYMTDDVLAKVDRMSMAHGLECRSPFMDHRLIEWAARLPARITVAADGTGKRVLGHLLARFLPEHLFRRPKQGFTPPWEQWCTGAVRETLRQDWRRMADPFMRKDAIDVLVPPGGGGSPVLSWMAYSYVTWRQGS